MNYLKRLSKLLKPRKKYPVTVLDLFSGCGGLSLGFEAFGMETIGYEMNNDAAKTYINNLKGSCKVVQLSEDFKFPKADIIIGGPPCQPFSVSGSQQGKRDIRNGFPVFMQAVLQVKPKVFLLENVTGLVWSNRAYLELLIKQFQQLGYMIECRIINAVNYGVPQKRKRLIVVGHKSHFNFPVPGIGKVTVQDAIGDIMYKVTPDSKFVTSSMDEYIAKYEAASACTTPRDLHPLKPSRTLTCKNLAGATGDMQRILLKDGRRKRLSVREAARLQSFPDWFIFHGSESSQFKQIGNAVPPLLAYNIAEEIYTTYKRRSKSAKVINQINATYEVSAPIQKIISKTAS
jgi:DNA (cytosine-5)-methyltransferase 1